MVNKLNWQGYATGDYTETIESVKDAISVNGAYIINFQMFSDLAISFTIEVLEKGLSGLYESLVQLMIISEPPPEQLHKKIRKGMVGTTQCFIY